MKLKIILLVLVSLLMFTVGNVKKAEAYLIDFENLPDLTSVGDSYASYGVHFNNAISLTAGFSLNEFDFPPSSGLVAIGDNNAPIQIVFDTPANNLFANFTFASQLTFSAFDNLGSLLGSFTNPEISNLGSSELIALNFSNVKSLTIAGQQTNSFIMDDFGVDPPASVPEPSTIFLLVSGLTGLAGFGRKFADKSDKGGNSYEKD